MRTKKSSYPGYGVFLAALPLAGSTLAATGGKAETDDFLRLYMVPGMKHCNNGAGFHDFDAFGALQAWVEEGEAPEAIDAYSPQTQMSRSLCAYPDVPRLGEPSLDPAVADSFVCMAP